MAGITYYVTLDDELKKVVISHDKGGTWGYSIYINNYYQGLIFYRDGRWTSTSMYGWDTCDIEALGELVDEYLK